MFSLQAYFDLKKETFLMTLLMSFVFSYEYQMSSDM